MAKKNKKNESLFNAARLKAASLAPKENNFGMTQADVDAITQRRLESTAQRQASRAAAAPVQTSSASDRLSAVARDRVSYETTGHSTYFDDQPRASERLRNNSSSASYANDRAPRFDYGRNDTQLRRRSNQGAGKLKTTYDGDTARYQYERDPRNDSLNASYSHMAAENGTWQQRRNSPLMGKLTDKLGVDRSSQYMTQETDRTVKYDDGRKTEYFVVDGKGDDARLISVPEERYFQQQQLDGGLNPETMTPYKRLQGAAEHGIKNALHGLKSTYGSIQSNKNDQQRAKEYAETHPNGNNLNRRRDMLMGSYGAAGAVRGGDDVKANEYVNQEAMEDIMREREQLEQQKKLDEMYQTYKAGASKPMQLAMDVTDTTANMAPGMLSNFLLPGSYIPEMAVQAYGNSYNQARINGATHDEAILSGIQNAAVESLSESLFAGGRFLGKATGVKGIFRPGKAIEDATLPFIRSTAGKDVVRTVQKLGLAGTEEGAEELVAGIAEPVLDALIYQGGIDTLKDPDFWTSTVHDALYNGLVGFASGGGFGTVDVAQSIRQGADIRAHADVANMINQGLAMPEGSEANNIARRMQLQDPANYGNIDTSDLARAIQEGQKDINETVSKKQKNTDQILERKNIGHRAEAAEASYNRALQSESMHEEAIKSGMTEAEAEGIRIEMSAQGEEFGRYYKDAKAALADRLMPAMAEEASEDPDVVEANRAEAERQAEDGARTIARVMMGEATAADFQKFSTTNPALREAYEEITHKSIPDGNKATIDFMINENEDHYVAEQTTDQGRQMLGAVADFFGKESPEYAAFEKAMGDMSNVDVNLLSGVVRGFSDAYSLGRASDIDKALPARTPAMDFLTEEQIQKAFEAGKKERDTYLKNKRSNLNRAKKAAATRAKNAAYKKGGNFSMESLDDADAKKVSDGVKTFFKKTAERYGVNIVIEPNAKFVKGSKVSNGFYDPKTNTIHLNVDMKNNGQVSGFIPTFSHEFTHFLEDMAPEEYQMLHDFVVRTVNAKDPDRWEAEIQERMRRYGKGLTRAEAEREVIADMAQEIFADEKTISEFFGYDKSVAQKVMDAVTKIINEFIQFVKGTGESQFLKQIGAWEEYRDMWMRAAKAAKENGGLQVGSDVRNQLQDVGMTEQNGRAAWLPDRIDDLMQRYGGFGNYSQAWAVMMNPRDFLKLTLSDDQLDRWSSSAQNVPGDVKGMPYREAVDHVWNKAKETGEWIHDNENYPLDQDELASNEQTPFISIYEDSAGNIHVDGHEGRHRMRALMEAGITSVPVVVKDLSTKYSKTNVDSMTLSSQDFGRGPVNSNASVTVTDLVPIRRDNRDELMAKFGAKDEDQVRFQMQSPVEQKGDLIAMHNMTGEELLKTIDLGGFPMPSIAVTRASMGHSKYGDVSLLFHSDTIDPQRNRDNQVFGGDAYTPTFPSIRIKVNDKVESRISKIYYDLYSQYGYDAVRAMYSIAENLEDRLNNAGGEAALIDELKNDTALKRVFLLTKGKEIENVETRTEERMSDAEIEVCKFLINELGEDVVRDVSVPGGGIGHVREWYANNGEAVRAAYRKLLRENFGFNEQEVKNAEDSMNTMRYATEVRRAKTFMEKGPVTVKTEIDHDATNNAIEKEATKAGYDAWIEDLLSGAEEKQGIRNTKDPFTPSGNRRSWDALHDPVTLQNVVKAMRSELAAGGNGLFGANPKGAAQKEYKSLDELRADKGRLKMLSDEEYERLSGEALDSFTAVCQSIARHNYQDFDTHFGATLDTGESIAEVLNETRTKAGIKRALEKDYHLSVTDAEMNDLMDAIDAIANVPTGYFEAKPRRAVGLDEIRAAVIPDTASAELKDALDENGIEYIEYKEGDEEDRKTKVNEAAEEKELRFQIQIDTTEEEQFNELKDKVLSVPVIPEAMDRGAIPDTLDGYSMAEIKKVFWEYAKGTEITKGLSVIKDLDKGVSVNKKSIKETVGQQIGSGYGGSLEDLVYELPILRDLLNNAIHIKTIPDKYIGTSRENPELNEVYVLISAYQKGETVFPVLIEIMSYKDGANNLHLSVVLGEAEGIDKQNIKKEGVINAYAGENQPGRLLPSHEYSLMDIVAHVNPSDFGVLKYLPDQMLSEEQKEGKEKGIALDEVSLARIRARDREKNNKDMNGDVRRQLQSDRDREIADLQSKVERLQRDKRRTYGREASNADATRVARALLADTSSDFSLNQTIKAVKELFTMIKRGDDFADIYGYVQGIARSIADSSYDMVEIPGASDLADLRQRFLDARKSQGGSPLKILIPQNLIGDFDRVGGWKEFRAAHKGIVTLSVNSGESYDSFIEGIADEFGEQFNVEGDNSGIDTLISIIEAADSQEARHPVRKAYKDEDVEGVMPDDVDMGIMGGYRDTEVNEIIDRLLDDVADQVAPDLTFADRKAAEKDAAVKKARDNERAKWEARREQWRKDRDKRIAEMKEDKKLAVEAQRAKGKERLQKQAELYRRQREKARERRADTASRRKTLDRIYKTTQRLSQKLLKPTDSQHIPEKYRKAVADMLGWLDFENARTDQWAKRHGNVPSARILNMRKLQEVYAKIAEDEQLNKYIEPDDQIYEWLEYLSDIEGSRLDDLTTEQLRTVRLVLDAVSWQVNNADKALTEGLKQSRADIATELMDELEAQKDEKFSDGTFKKFIKADSTPVHFFERLGLNTLKKLYQQLTLAQDTHIKHLSEAQEYIEKNITSKWGNTAKVGNNSLIKKWTEESAKYELENGKTVEMTGAQVMSLYALNKREQARKHLLGGGIVIAPTKVKRNLKGGIKEYMLDRQLQKTRAELTYADITKILGKMSQEQIDAAEAMLKYLKTTSEWGNETSMKLYGYRKFTEDNYFPIQSAKEFIAGSNLELQRDKKIKNQGMTKNVNEYANNPIVIDDFFEVTTAHINQMSQYNSFVPILEDFDRIYQYSEYDPETQKYHRSVKELIEQKHGRWAADYIENLLKNVNGNYGNEVADIQGFEKLLRNWKAAKIGLSVRVFAQQPTAVVRAFNEIDPKYFVGTPKRGSHKRMWEICPIAEWKHWGYSQTDIHRSMRDTMMGDKHLSDKLFFDMYGKADDLGWGAIFDAVERETKDLMKKGKLKFEYDSAEYRQHVNERFRHIVDRTQVVDSVLHRSQLMRSQNTLTKAMTAFMAEPTISVNTIMTAFTKAQEEARAGHKAAAAKAASRGVGVFVANAVAVSLMASLISAIRESYLPDDDDDDDEKELTKLQQMMVNMGFEEGSFMYDWISGYFVEDFKGNINPLMMIPVAKDMLNMWQGYEAPNPMYQLPQSLIQTTQNMKKWIDEDGDTRYSGRYYIERAAESVAELFGVPAANIRKELIGIQNIYFRAIGEKEYGDYLQDRWELNEDYKSNKNIFIDHYLNAKKAGHDESAKDIREQLLKSKVRDDEGNLVFTDEAIQKRAWSVYAPNFKDDVIAGRDVSKQEKDLKSVGITAEDIDDKKSKALVSSISDAVEMGDTDRLEDLYGVLEKYGYGEYDVDKKVKSAASDLMYDAIDAENYDEADRYINVITDVTGYTRDDVVSSITTHYMSSYYEAMDAGDQSGVSRVTNILGKYGVSSNTIREKEAEHYKDYYRQKAYMAYSSGNTAEAYRIATEYNQKYPGVYSKGVDGMIYGIQNLSDDTIRRYTTSGKYDEWQLP